MRHLFSFFILVILASCVQSSKPIGNWIDVPLSENTYSESDVSYLMRAYAITVPAQESLEFTLAILEGNSIVYEWHVEMDEPELLAVEFHGHTERMSDAPGAVMFYKIHNDGYERGTLTAPFNGIHGWYLNNQSDEDVVVQFTVSGFYSDTEK